MKHFCLIVYWLGTSWVFAVADNDYLTYSIPPDAKRTGPGPSRDRNLETYCYYPSGEEPKLGHAISYETYKNGQLIKRRLFKNGRTHGVQREWYDDGAKKSEDPYKNGVMHGTYRKWDDKGRLVAQYEIIEGKGTVREYDGDGKLIFEKEVEGSMGNGRFMHVVESNGYRTFYVARDDDKVVGRHFEFYISGELYSIYYYSDVLSHGPRIEFSKNGEVIHQEWYVKDKKVTAAEYRAAIADDPTLPPYYADAKKYRELVEPSVFATEESYRKMPIVKIPMEFDKAGNPVLAE